MATVVNNPGNTDSSSGMGFLVGVLLLILFVLGLLYFGLPRLNQATQAPSVNVPEEVDVNVNTPNGAGGEGN